jgi:hypothetical protein
MKFYMKKISTIVINLCSFLLVETRSIKRMTVSGPETQFEKRRQLEKRLEQDHEELEALQQSLTKTTAFTDKVVRFFINGRDREISSSTSRLRGGDRLGCSTALTSDLENSRALSFQFIM